MEKRCQKSDFVNFQTLIDNKGMTETRYCAFCRTPRKIYSKSRLGVWDFLQAIGLAVSCSLIFWNKLDAKALMIFVSSLMLGEVIMVVRRAFSLPCSTCGFDPALYLKSKKKAEAKVIAHLERRKNDPGTWLSKKPPLNLPYRQPPKEMPKNLPSKKNSTREIIA